MGVTKNAIALFLISTKKSDRTLPNWLRSAIANIENSSIAFRILAAIPLLFHISRYRLCQRNPGFLKTRVSELAIAFIFIFILQYQQVLIAPIRSGLFLISIACMLKDVNICILVLAAIYQI